MAEAIKHICQLCGDPMSPASKRYHPSCQGGRKKAHYSRRAARRRAAAMVAGGTRSTT